MKSYIPSAVVAALILYLSLLRVPHLAIPEFMASFRHLDKVVHALMYLCLGAVMVRDMWSAGSVRSRKRLFWGCMACLLVIAVYGGVIEILQELYFPPRTGEWADWAADIAGGCSGVAIAGTMCYKKLV